MNQQAELPPGALLPASLARKRELGAFYTPANITKTLCGWAIQSAHDVVLEPSFGGCTFLEASIKRMLELGATTAQNLHGCDIDPQAFDYLRANISSINPKNFYLCDFLQWQPTKIPRLRVDAVIGNPPYVRYSKLDAKQCEAINQWEEHYGLHLNRRASLWTYFTFHALHFLKKGGRLAWILPVSLMTARYAEKLRSTLLSRFEKIAFITLTERIFLMEGTEERTVIVLADGYMQSEGTADATSICLEDVTNLENTIQSWMRARVESMPAGEQLAQGMMPLDATRLMSDLKLDRLVSQLGDLASIGIGVVSGDSKFFIKSLEGWRAEGIGKTHLSYIAPRSRWIQGICLTPKDQKSHEDAGIPCLAFAPPTQSQCDSVINYLSKYDDARKKANATFAKRPTWFRFIDDKVPDALLVFMTHLGPRLITNDAKANATNSLHRVDFTRGYKTKAKLIAISMQTTFTQLAAEQLGLSRGSGALKLEPGAAKLLPIYLPEKSPAETNRIFSTIDRHMRAGQSELARKVADSFTFSDSHKFMNALPALEKHLETVRRRRIRTK